MVLNARVKTSLPAERAGDGFYVAQRENSPVVRGDKGPPGAGGNVLAITHQHGCGCSGPRAARLGKCLLGVGGSRGKGASTCHD